MNNNGQPAELAGSAAGADIEEADLESLGLGLFDVDAELAECLENYPEWNDALFSDSVLDELRDCLSDDLWAAPDLQLLTGGEHGAQSESQGSTPNAAVASSPIAAFPGPPTSPPSALSPTPSLASVASAASSTLSCPYSDGSTPQKVPSPWSDAAFAQSMMSSPPQSEAVAQPQSCAAVAAVPAAVQLPIELNLAEAVAPTAVQVLKSGEVVQMMVSPQQLPSLPQQQQQQQQQQITGVQLNPKTPPTPIQTPPNSAQSQSAAVGQPSPAAQSPSKTEDIAGPSTNPAGPSGRKRQHPDSGPAGSPSSDVRGGVNISQLSKKQQRLIKNREAASVSRQKKKEYVQTLEARLKEAAVKNSALLQENEALRKQVVLLEAENKVLKVNLSKSYLNTALQRPALVMVVCLCFVSLLFLPKFTNLSLVSPGSTSTALSVTQSSHVPGRALLQYKETQDSLPPSPSGRESRRSGDLSVSSNRALVPVSSSLSERAELEEALDKKIQQLHRLYTALHCPPPPVSSVCSCPAQSDPTTNSTALRLLSEEMAECFKWYEQHYPRWLHQSSDMPSEVFQNSLAVVVNSKTANQLRGSGDYQVTELHDMPLLYKSFKKYFTRKLDTFYLISFKDHLLLNAPLHNTTEHPILSVIIPTQGFSVDTVPMLQMDCEILSTDIIHLPRASASG